MGKKTTVICDNCGKDVTETDEMPAYRIVVAAERLPSSTNITFAINMPPPIEEVLYFCSIGCLKEYFNS